MQKSLVAIAIFVILGIGASAGGCLDVTPITDVPAIDAGPDVSVSASLAATPCFQCSAGSSEGGPSCGAEYAVCRADAKCITLFLCGIPRGCYGAGQDLIACLTACGIAAGLTGIDDPAVAPFVALYGCATTSCSSACTSVPRDS
jgi:hypothetical protein